MASDASTATAPNGTDALLQSLVRGGRGRALRAQLAARYPDCSPDAIEEAIQYACKSFLDEAEGITAPGQVYAWIRTAAHRSLPKPICTIASSLSIPSRTGWTRSAPTLLARPRS
jgi:hypothetical protein